MKIFTSTRKIQVYGSSYALTLPSFYSKVCYLEKGQVVNVFYDLDGTLILSKSNNLEDLRNDIAIFLNKMDAIGSQQSKEKENESLS